MAAAPLTDFAVHLRPQDNVAVCRKPIPAGTDIAFDGATHPRADRRSAWATSSPCGRSRKARRFSSTARSSASPSEDIAPGEHVHVHNVAPARSSATTPSAATARRRCRRRPSTAPSWATTAADRPDHLRYGTRNYIAIISTVNCSASTSKYISERVRATGPAEEVPERRRRRRRSRTRPAAPCSTTAPTTSSSTARSPASPGTRTSPPTSSSASAARPARRSHLIESEQLDLIQLNGAKKHAAGAVHPGVRRHRQDGRGRREGRRRAAAARQRRASACKLPAKHIILGTNCGGSDGNSGVTANPALGVASDLLVAAGRHEHPRRDAGDLRRRAPADAPGRHRARSARSWSSASSGGSGTPASSAPRSTTTRRPATRKAA